MARSIAIVCRNLLCEQSDLLSIGRFDLVRTLGRGGHGVVYEAFDPLRREPVALKVLYGSGPTTLYRLKREFRALAELRHRNLVTLHELSVGPGEAYFTMDLVAGEDLLAHVQRVTATVDEPLARVRDALGQLCEGVRALHSAGKLHRDLKPSNVRVTRSGRVVLLDFGLVDDAGAATEPEGTRAYMAPEQARGEACEGSDWYSFGKMLGQALHCVRAGAAERLERKSLALSDVLALEQLALNLQHSDPAHRPGWLEISERLCTKHAAAPRVARMAAPARELGSGFLARQAELEQLMRAFARSQREPVFVRIRAEAGMGKSALLQQFAQLLSESRPTEVEGVPPLCALAERDVLVLRGRCYEREMLPYKALDSAIDELSRTLMLRPEQYQEGALGEDHSALLALFPVLGRVSWLRAQPATAAAGVDHLAQQVQGFAQLRALLCRLSAQRALVLCIDDLQWADEDSGRILGALLCEEDSPRVLIVATDRSDLRTDNPALDALERVVELSPRPLPIEELELGPLSVADGMALARASLVEAGEPDDVELEQLVREARGNPRGVRELVRARPVRSAGHTLPPASLGSLIETTLQRLLPESRLTLELLAAAGRPLPMKVLAAASETGHESHTHVKTLRALGVVRAVLRDQDEWLELEHDRIAEVVLERITGAQLRELHCRLVRALELQYGTECEALIEPYLGAGMPLSAARCARALAERALAGFAFARAARLFEQALAFGQWDDTQLAALHGEHARALEAAGRGLEAAEAYARSAALTSQPLARALLEQRSADHLLRNDRIEAGEALLSRAYTALELVWPKSRLALWLAIARQLLPAWLRRNLRRRSVPVELHRARAVLLARAGGALEGYDLWRALHNALVCCEESEQTGDPAWCIRSSGTRGFLRSLALWPGSTARGIAELERACARAELLADAAASGEMTLQLALAHTARGAPGDALAAAARSEAWFRTLPSSRPDVNVVRSVLGTALFELGRLREARKLWNVLTYTTRLHGDVMSVLWVHAQPVQLATLFASDERARVEAILERAGRLRAEHPRYLLLGWVHAAGSLEYALYRGAGLAALQIVEREQRVLFGQRLNVLLGKARLIRARACLEAASELPQGRDRIALLRRAARDAAALRRGRSLQDARMALLLLAGVARLRGQTARALALLEDAAAALEASDARLFSAGARYFQGALVGGDAGTELQAVARAAFEREGVVDIARYVPWLVCGFRAKLSPDR